MGARKPRPLFFYGTPVERSLLFSNFKMKVHHFFIFLSYILFTWQYLIEHHLRYLSMERCLALQGVNSSQSRATQVLILLLFSCPFYCLCHCFLISCVYNHPKISLKFKAAPTFSLSMYNLSNLGDPLRTISPSQTPSTSLQKTEIYTFHKPGGHVISVKGIFWLALTNSLLFEIRNLIGQVTSVSSPASNYDV